MAQLTFSKVTRVAGSDRSHINVDRDGVPFAQLWTFKDTKTDKHGWHAVITGTDHYEVFYSWNKGRDLTNAQAWVQRFANRA